MIVEIYCDGSGNTMTGTGGWAFRIIVDGTLKVERGGHLPYATNNVAELYAAVEGLKELEKLAISAIDSNTEIYLISDSKLVLGYADGTYRCKAKHLETLHSQLRQLYLSMPIKTKWVKGHSGDPNNEACDKLAKSCRINEQ